MVTPVKSGPSTPIQSSQGQDSQVRRGDSLDLRPQQAPVHEALVSRRADSLPHVSGSSESTERPRLDLETLKASMPKMPPSSSAEPTSPRILEISPTFKDGIGGTSTQKQQGKAQLFDLSLPEIKERFEPFKPVTISSSTAEGKSQRILTSQLTFKDGIGGETSTQKQKGKGQFADRPLLDTKERSDRYTFETSSIDHGAHTHSHRSQTSHLSHRSHRSHRSTTMSHGGSTGSSHISSAGIGEKRPKHGASARDMTTGSQLHTPLQSERFSFPPSGELHMTDPQTFPVFGTTSESSRVSSGEGSPPRAASWRATIAGLARKVGQQAVQTASVVTVLKPNARLLTAAAGHLAHQAVSVGIPTFAREMLAQGLMAGLHRASPQAAVGLQAGMLVMNIGLQVVRERREARDPNEAARAFHSLSADQWEQSSSHQQEAMRNTQAKHSRLLSVLQVASSAINLGLSFRNASSGEATAAIQRVATDMKTSVYTTMRDSLQASFRMVGIAGETHGLSGAHLTTAIATYAAVQVTGNYAGQALVAGAAPEASTATNVLNGLTSPAAAGMSKAAAWGTAATVAGVKAAVNTVVETIDWFQRTQLEADQGGARQELNPRINTAPEHRDYGRLLDHTPGRMAVINTNNAMVGAASYLARNSSAALQSLIGNAGSAAVSAMTDYSVSNTWQAAAAVRAATSPPPPEPNGTTGHGPTNPPPPPPPEQNA